MGVNKGLPGKRSEQDDLRRDLWMLQKRIRSCECEKRSRRLDEMETVDLM